MLFSTTNTTKKASTTTAKEESSSFSSGALLSVAPRPKIYSENSFIVDEQLAEDECLCEVCCDLIDFATSSVLFDMEDTMTCKHKICLRCWKLHLTTKLQQENMTMVIIFVVKKNFQSSSWWPLHSDVCSLWPFLQNCILDPNFLVLERRGLPPER